MPNQLYELLVRFDENGKFKGAHQQVRDSDTGIVSTVALNPTDWESVALGVNTATLVALESSESAHTVALESAKADCAAQIFKVNDELKATQDAVAPAVAAALLAAQGEYDKLVQAAESAMAAGDTEMLRSVLDAAKGFTSAARKKVVEDEIVFHKDRLKTLGAA